MPVSKASTATRSCRDPETRMPFLLAMYSIRHRLHRAAAFSLPPAAIAALLSLLLLCVGKVVVYNYY